MSDKKEEGRRKKEEGRGKKEEGRGKKKEVEIFTLFPSFRLPPSPSPRAGTGAPLR
ncbi:MAG: hypothetical protein HC849_29860 [Oscillatoriales cyanobacterium RU_3_3]|nr:hypothetical protein [Oscillatoriales cyanobacterium RU_3_3]